MDENIVENLEKVNHELYEKNVLLEEKMAQLLEKQKEKEEKNKRLQKQIDELVIQMKQSEQLIDKTRKSTSINEVSLEPKIYLKGMFKSFIEEKNALLIMINGREYYYPLHEYQSAHLPLPGSRVLIFRSQNDTNLIYGFDVSKMIDIAPKVEATVKFSSPLQNRLKLHVEKLGYIDLCPHEDFWKSASYKIGATLILSQISINANYYFYISQKIDSRTNRNEILKLLLENK